MSKYSALIVWGGWDGHEPKQVGEILAAELRGRGFDVEVSDTLDSFKDAGEKLKDLSLIVPIWTMGEITNEQLNPILEAVKSGVGIAGCHGGMCDSFRTQTEYQFMTGGQWVSHPGGGVDYTVRITNPNHFITAGAPAEFAVSSEQYYMHTDPANVTLAVTEFPTADGPHVKNGKFDMPVIWTKYYGEGRVAYNSLGHSAETVRQKEYYR